MPPPADVPAKETDVVGRAKPPVEERTDPGGDPDDQGGDRVDRLAEKVDRLADLVTSLIPTGGDGGDDPDSDEGGPGPAGKPKRAAFSTREIELGAELMMEKAQRRLREMDPPRPAESKVEATPAETAPVKTPFLRKILWGEEVK